MTGWFAEWFYVGIVTFMIVCVPLFMALWSHWTGVWTGFGRLVLATLGLLLGVALTVALIGLERTRHTLFMLGWGMGGMWLLLWGLAVPTIRRATADLPELPRAASLRPRRIELFRGAFVWPFVAWAALAAWQLASGDTGWTWLFPLLGLASLLMLRFTLPLAVQEPEPLGGPDPEGLARAYEEFRRRRVHQMYWMFVALSLFVTGGWGVVPGIHPGWLGSIAGTLIGLWGATLGMWADAQRYLLRRRLSGAEPPA